MSAPDRSHAKRYAQEATTQLNRTPTTAVSTDPTKQAAVALAAAGIGAVYALLDIADAIRSHRGHGR